MRGARSNAAAASPVFSVIGGKTSCGFCRAVAMSSTAGSASYSTAASFAARRAASRVVAATANSGWPTYSTRPAANSGSSWRPIGLTSFSPGTSSAVNTATTPGAARTSDRSMDSTRACAFADRPRYTCSSPAGSGMSST